MHRVQVLFHEWDAFCTVNVVANTHSAQVWQVVFVVFFRCCDLYIPFHGGELSYVVYDGIAYHCAA